MKIRGNGLAIALSGLAVAMAASGTAYAVTATQVHLVDATHAANVAHVTSGGRVSVTGATSTIQVLGYLYSSEVSGTYPLVGPTKASLAVTAVNYNNSRNKGATHLDYGAALAKITVGSSGGCFDSDRTIAYVREDALDAGTSSGETFPAPLVFKADGGKAYCLAVELIEDESVIGVTQYPVGVTIDAYVTAGSYTGSGTAVATHAPGPRRASA